MRDSAEYNLEVLGLYRKEDQSIEDYYYDNLDYLWSFPLDKDGLFLKYFTNKEYNINLAYYSLFYQQVAFYPHSKLTQKKVNTEIRLYNQDHGRMLSPVQFQAFYDEYFNRFKSLYSYIDYELRYKPYRRVKHFWTDGIDVYQGKTFMLARLGSKWRLTFIPYLTKDLDFRVETLNDLFRFPSLIRELAYLKNKDIVVKEVAVFITDSNHYKTTIELNDKALRYLDAVGNNTYWYNPLLRLPRIQDFAKGIDYL